MGNCCSNPPAIDISISTLGDSLTDNGYYGQIMDYNIKHTNWYQFFMYEELKTRNIESVIIDLGIGGQTITQICNRILSAVPATYITILAGTNDVASANYSDPSINEKLATHIIETYKQKIPEVIQYQKSTSGFAPIVIVCTIPPVGDVESTLPLGKMSEAIDYVNEKLKVFIENWEEYPNVLLCDTNRSLKGTNGRFIPGLCVQDGIHFTENGKLVCGQTIANTIIENYYKLNSAK